MFRGAFSRQGLPGERSIHSHATSLASDPNPRQAQTLRRLSIPIEAAVLSLASWTLAFHLVLVMRWPAWTVCAGAAALLAAGLTIVAPTWAQRLRGGSRQEWWVLAIALLAATASLFSARSSADDASFFHRALVQISDMNQPLFLTDTQHNVADLPAISPLHAATSYELLAALAPRALGIDPLWFYQNATAFIAIVLLALTLASLYVRLRMRSNLVAATAVALLFLMFDGNTPRAFGVKGFAMLWQGRSIVWGLLIPITLLLALRFLARPTARRWMLLACCGVCGVGLSNSGVYLIPLTIVATSAAHWLTHRARPRSARRTLLAGAAAFYGITIAGAIVTGILASPDMSVWEGWSYDSWWKNLLFNIAGQDDKLTAAALMVLRYAAILGVLPWFALGRASRRFMLLYLAILLALVANPLTGPLWMERLTSASYWRVAYLFPVGLCAGLIVPVLWQAGATSVGRKRAFFAGVLAIAAFLASYRDHALHQAKSPAALRLDADAVAFCRAVRPALRHANLLTDPHMARTVGLIEPSVRLETTRPAETLHLFRAVGREDEGARRVLAQTVLTAGVRNPQVAAAIAAASAHGVNAIIVQNEHAQTVRDLLEDISESWRMIETQHDWMLFVKD